MAHSQARELVTQGLHRDIGVQHAGDQPLQPVLPEASHNATERIAQLR